MADKGLKVVIAANKKRTDMNWQVLMQKLSIFRIPKEYSVVQGSGKQ